MNIYYICIVCDINENKKASFRLENQLCFPIYATSRMIIQLYQPLLDKIGLTYPQYLVMMVLAEKDDVPVKHLTDRLLLNTNTLTPLLKRMEKNDLLSRKKCTTDERRVMIQLTHKGKEVIKKACEVPEEMMNVLKDSPLSEEDLLHLKKSLNEIIHYLQKK